VQGRLFDARDGADPNVQVVVVDRAWATRFFPNRSAVGKRFREGGCTSCPWTTVVGVVSDVKYAGLDKPDQGSVYTPMDGRGSTPPSEATTTRSRYLILRTRNDPAMMLPAVRQIIRELNPSVPLSNVATIDDLVAQSLQRPRSLSELVGGFAIVALVLSIVGIFGMMAYYVQQHAKDISIRMALGGRSADVMRLVVGQGMLVVTSGIGVGLLTALVLTRFMSSLLFSVGAVNVFTFGVVCILLLALALVACVIPARRAMRLEPAVVLRNE